MQLDSQELAALAQAAVTPRMDMYAFIHKALRAYMSDTLVALGRVDVNDEPELGQICDRVRQLLDFCRAHLRHENDFIHPAMERHLPGSAAAVAQEHVGHVQAIATLADGTAQLWPAPRAARRSRMRCTGSWCCSWRTTSNICSTRRRRTTPCSGPIERRELAAIHDAWWPPLA